MELIKKLGGDIVHCDLCNKNLKYISLKNHLKSDKHLDLEFEKQHPNGAKRNCYLCVRRNGVCPGHCKNCINKIYSWCDLHQQEYQDGLRKLNEK